MMRAQRRCAHGSFTSGDVAMAAPRLIITFLGMIFSTITRAGNVIFI